VRFTELFAETHPKMYIENRLDSGFGIVLTWFFQIAHLNREHSAFE
jgi:hypothetical protein